MKNLRDMRASSSMMHGKRSPKARHWSERIVRQIETRRMKEVDGRCYVCMHVTAESNAVTCYSHLENAIMSRGQFAFRRGFERNRESSRGLHCDEKVIRRCCNNAIEQMHRAKLIGNVQQIADNDTLRVDTMTERLENCSERIY